MGVKHFILGLYKTMPLNFRHHLSGYNRVYRFYQEAQWWPLDKIREWQLNRLKQMIRYAYQNTEGYRCLYNEAGVTPDDLRCLDDIKGFPTTDKELIRNNISAFTPSSKIAGRLCLGSTGGSTGHPFEFYYDLRNADAEYAFIENAWASVGWSPKDTGIVLRGTHVGSASNLIVKKSPNRYFMSSVYMTDEMYEQYMETIETVKATYLHVYPSTICDLANLIIKHGDVGRLNIRQIFIGSENFYSWQKEIVHKAFPDAALMSWYGHSERAIWAPWCEKVQKYHLNPFYGFTEILNGNFEVNEGEIGELVGTAFWMYGTPFIRYKTGDFAEKGASTCKECGRNFQLINYVDGRKAEIIIGKTGRRVSLTVFAGSIMHGHTFEKVRQFRFYQEKEGIITLFIVPLSDFSELDGEQIAKSIKSFLGDDFNCEIRLVEGLEKSKSGKFSYLEQHLAVERAEILNY